LAIAGPARNLSVMTPRTPEEIHARLAAAFSTGDRAALIALYEDEAALIVPPEGRCVTGRDAIREAVEPMLSLQPSFRSDVVGKLEGDGLAVTHARWQMAGTQDGERVELSGRGTLVSRRQPDGGWRIVLDNPMTP
jgi:uncharacterized protein (TIGR02246 family)